MKAVIIESDRTPEASHEARPGEVPRKEAARGGRPQTPVLDFRVFSAGGEGVRPAALLLALSMVSPALAGTVKGKVDLLEKGGRKATDLSEVVVYVDGVKVRQDPVRATIVMKGKAFSPRVVVVPVGGTVEFPNNDPIFHNVFSVSGENRFDLDLYKRPKSGAFTFQRPGLVRVYCNIHPQMSAVVLVRDNPYFTRAGQDGSFTIEGVPAGRYTLKAWHERAGEVALELTVPAQGEVAGRITLDASNFKREPHKNKFGQDYNQYEEKY
jgi:plastocyanin